MRSGIRHIAIAFIVSITMVVIVFIVTREKGTNNLDKNITEKKLVLNRLQKIEQMKIECDKSITASKRMLLSLKEPSKKKLQEIEELKSTLEEIYLELENSQVKEHEIKELKLEMQEKITAIERDLIPIKDKLLNKLKEFDFFNEMNEYIAAAERMLVLLKKLHVSEHRLQGQEIEALKWKLKHIDDIIIENESQLQEIEALKLKLEVIKSRIHVVELRHFQKLLEEKESETYKAITAIETKLTSLKELSVNKLKEIAKYKLRQEDSDRRNESNTFAAGDEVTIVQKVVTGGKPDTIVWPDNSFKMEIPPESFPDGRDITISISLDPSHRIKIPEGYKSLSQTYKITATEKLQDSVIITLKHNGVITSIKDASSVTVLHQCEEGTVEMLQGTAAVNSSFVVFQLSQLSWIEIVGAPDIAKNYSITFHRRQLSNTNGQLWSIGVLLSPNRHIILKNSDWIPDDVHDDILPSITINEATVLSWEIEPFGCWTVSKYTANIVKVNVTNENDDFIGEFKMKWNYVCTNSLSLIRLYDSKHRKLYDIFQNPETLIKWNKIYSAVLFVIVMVLSIYLPDYFAKKNYIRFPRSLTYIMTIAVICCAYVGYLKYMHYVFNKDHNSKQDKSELNLNIILEITQLEEVKQALRQSYFDTTKWRSVGLSLGLYDNTLSAIERNSNDVEECLRKTLRAWLERSDGVINKGGATWQSLANALRDNNLIAAAESIEKKDNNQQQS